ncbi:MAG: recombination protein O N-terminal domain-containing protein, partial [bacterium]|nr:recombination protein O N-terminal domain-containing protein [bacterium]
MNEYYFNEAIVLDREPSGETDNRFSIYAKGFGKIVARGKSTRKITSKLSGHLEPGNLVKVRLIEKNGLQVVDALKSGKLGIRSADLHFLNRL